MLADMLDLFERVLLLEEVPLLQRVLDGAALLAIARRAQVECVIAGASVLAPGIDDRIFVVVSGTVDILCGRHALARLGPGELFGEMASFAAERPAVIARAEVVLMSLRRSELHAALDDRPEVALSVVEDLTRRLRSLIQLPMVFAAC